MKKITPLHSAIRLWVAFEHLTVIIEEEFLHNVHGGHYRTATAETCKTEHIHRSTGLTKSACFHGVGKRYPFSQQCQEWLPFVAQHLATGKTAHRDDHWCPALTSVLFIFYEAINTAVMTDTRHTVYCLHSTRTCKGRQCDRSYIGYTVDMAKRLRQHNGELVGGAKATRWCEGWRVVWTVKGFATVNHALQLEWRLHHPNGRGRRRGRKATLAPIALGRGVPPRRGGGNSIARRTGDLLRILQLERFTGNAPRTDAGQYTVTWYAQPDYDSYAAARNCPSYVHQCILQKTPSSTQIIDTTATNDDEGDTDASPPDA